VPGVYRHFGAVAVEHREGVFEANAELADHLIGPGELLFVLLLGEVPVAEAPTVIADVGRVFPVKVNVYWVRAREDLLVERIGDDLPDPVARAPRLQEVLFHVEVEVLPGLCGSWALSRRHGIGIGL